MPNGRLERTRASLPKGYQFGDAGIVTTAHQHAFTYQPARDVHVCACGLELHRRIEPHGVRIENA